MLKVNSSFKSSPARFHSNVIHRTLNQLRERISRVITAPFQSQYQRSASRKNEKLWETKPFIGLHEETRE